MGNVFFSVYRFFNNRRWLGLLILIAYIGYSGYEASLLKFEENILNTIPEFEQSETIEILFDEEGLGNKVIFHLYHEGDSTNPEDLIRTCDQMVDSLKSNYSQYLSNIRYKVSDQNINHYYDFFYENLPLYLNEQDYEEIKGKLSKASIEETIEKNYKLLSTPMGSGVKKMIVKDPLSFTPLALDKLNSFQFDDNFSIYQNHILTSDKRHLVFFIDLATQGSETSDNARFFENINKTIDQISRQSEVNIEYFGSPAVAVANANRIKKDIQLSVTLALILIFTMVLFFFKKLNRILLIILPGALGAIFSIGFLAVTFQSISVIALGIGSVLLGITVDYSLHIFTHFKKEKDIRILYRDISTPLLLSSVTTSLAFFSLLFLKSEVLKELGVFAGISVLFASVFALLILPHFLNSERKSNSDQQNIIERWVYSLASLKPEKSKWTIITIIGVIIICLFTWDEYQFEEDMMKINYMPDQLAAYEERINDISNLSQKKFYLAVSDSTFEGALKKNRSINARLKELKRDGIILNARYINNLIPDSATQKEKYQQYRQFWSSQNGDSILQLVKQAGKETGFSEKAFSGFEQLVSKKFQPIGQENFDFIRKDMLEDLIFRKDGKVILLTQIVTTQDQKEKAIAAFSEASDIDVLDKQHITSQLVKYLSDNFSTLVNISLILVFAILLLVYGRIELAVLAFIPIISSWICTLGIMGIFGLKFNIVNIIISTFIFGLGIDYSIFVLRGLIQKFATNDDQLISYKKSILLSAMTTLIGMGVLIFAQHPALKSIALLAITGILSVLIITFVLQPWLFNLLILNRKKSGKIPLSVWGLFVSVFSFFSFLIGCVILNVIRILFLFPIGNKEGKKRLFHHLIKIFCQIILKTCFNLTIKTENFDQHTLDQPAILIANHSSFIDILYVLCISHKIVIMTNEWVYNSPFFGKAVQYVDFIRASEGYEEQVEKAREQVKKGYSVVIFPEGTRSETADLRRFHKGAFYLAESLGLDIIPVLLHGAHYVLSKTDTFNVKRGRMTAKFLDRIRLEDTSFGEGYKERTKKVSRYFKSEFYQFKKEKEQPGFFKDLIFKNYLYKGPVLEWYVKIKFKLENQYQLLHQLIPDKGKIIDLGCGYGYTSLSLALTSSERDILGIDYDEYKINIAKNIPTKCPNLSFENGDVTTFRSDECDLIILSDVLHYLTPEEQVQTLTNCYDSLSDEGKLLIRDGDINLKSRQRGTWLTEFFSTNIGFNKTRNNLNFISSDFIMKFAEDKDMQFQEIDQSKMTSNKFYCLSKNG